MLLHAIWAGDALVRVKRRASEMIRGTALAALVLAGAPPVAAQAPPQPSPTVNDPELAVRTVAFGLTQPVSMAFLGDGDILVLEKSTGMVKRIKTVGGTVQIQTVLDLAVNSASERGLLGIALHPDFPANPGVYLYWTARTAVAPADPFSPDVIRPPSMPDFGPDTTNILQVPLLGNRVDRFVWNGESLVFHHNLIMLHAFQNEAAPIPPGQGDEAQRPAGNHNGGVLRFGPDKKLYIIIGDNGRRGWMQNLPLGPTPPTADDQFGGPESDDAHLTGVILRLEDDGSIPRDNPFVKVGARIGGEVGLNLMKVFSYGRRNSFGMAFDPDRGDLWIEENGDDTFDEINRVESGDDGGWVQVMGPIQRIGEFKGIETTLGSRDLQQLRWPPTMIADSPGQAISRMFRIPGSTYRDPEFSWKFSVAPAGLGFLEGDTLGEQYEGDLFVGAARPTLAGGYLFRFKLHHNRKKLDFGDQRLRDGVADNAAKFDITESESLLFGQNFGVGTDIHTGPDGQLYVVSNTRGSIFAVYRPDRDDDRHGKGRGRR